MAAEPEVITSGPLRPLAEVRAGTGFAWSCRQGRVESGQLTEVHQITSGDRKEYERHMHGHGRKPPKSGYEPWKPWKPWKPPRPAREYAPKPMDPGQRVEWVTVTEAHHENPGYLAADGAYVPASGAWIGETRQARTGVIWSVADTASAWWVQPDDDPARPVYVKRAGKSWRDRSYGEGTLYEVPGAAETARANVLRGELVRRRGIFPVVDAVINGHTGNYYGNGSNKRVSVMWHSDPACPRAQGKERYDPGSPGFAYSFCSGRDVPWTPLDVAEVLASGGQPPSGLCPDCIVNLALDRPAAPVVTAAPEPDPISGPAADPATGTSVPRSAAGPGGAPTRSRFVVNLSAPGTDAEFLDSCLQLGDVLTLLAGHLNTWAERLAALNLPEPVLSPLHQAADGLTAARAAVAQAAQAFEDEFTGARDVAACGLRFTGQDTA
jgi:hypothetical protein